MSEIRGEREKMKMRSDDEKENGVEKEERVRGEERMTKEMERRKERRRRENDCGENKEMIKEE